MRSVESYLQDGYRRVKIKIKPGREVEETLAVRKAYPDLRLQVDANSAYTLADIDKLRSAHADLQRERDGLAQAYAVAKENEA